MKYVVAGFGLALFVVSISGLLTFKETYINAPPSFRIDMVVFIMGLVVGLIFCFAPLWW